MNEELLAQLANILQIYNTMLLTRDASNNDLMRELQKQNTEYFETIIKNQQEILKILNIKDKNNE